MTASNTTVDDENPVVQYTASSGQTIFDAPWLFFEDSDLTVYLTPVGNDADDTADLLTLTTDYTVTNTDTETGGTIVLNSGATTDDIITIYRVMTLERQTDYQASGDLLAETLNKEQDTAMMILQQLRETISRALGFKRTETSSASLQIPSPIAGYVLAWNSGATALENKLWHDASDVATNTADIATNTSDISDNTDAILLKAAKTYVDAADALAVLLDGSRAMTGDLTVDGDIASVKDDTSVATINARNSSGGFSFYTDASGNILLTQTTSGGGFEGIWMSVIRDGGFSFYHNGSKKLETHALGAVVTGKLEADSYSVGGAAGATGTFTNSITVVNGIVTAGS